ncbi:MAG: tRNA (adenosine(37)-N6)-threonylcarbamoyltransferase complex dimerization subunit type 1 TsaB [Oscillospiraceae bacterium]|nr:tRNA (adenosine(37)-N6)-threonylcarbamoyltransferase complex dimerization subunit type 1 TsaB [Oscillospiraceae bacterium]
MLILALESSAKAASAAIFEDGGMLGLSVANAGLTHSRTLLPMAEALLKNLDKTLPDLDAVAVAQGPGSFTGLRIGLSEAKGLCWALEIPAIGVSTLEAMAWGGPDREGAMLCCAMDARRSQVYNALFTVENGCPRRLTPDRAIAVEELKNELKAYHKPWILLGDGAALCYNILSGEPDLALHLAPEPLRIQSARGVGLAARDKAPVPPEELLPVYLRLSQAERERQAKMKEPAKE